MLIQWLRRLLLPVEGELPDPASIEVYEGILQESRELRDRTMYEQEHRERILRILEARARLRGGGHEST